MGNVLRDENSGEVVEDAEIPFKRLLMLKQKQEG